MKFIISTQEFNYMISKLINVVSPKATIPILSNILIEVKGDELILTATDLTVGVRCRTDAKVLEEGGTTLPAKRLSQFVKELNAVNLEIHTYENEVTEIIADSSSFKLHGMNKNEFPSLPEIDSATQITLAQKDLKNMLFRTSFAVSREDNRYVLTGVFFHIENGKATFVGTDGKRLAKTHLDVPLDPNFSKSYIVPLKAVEEIQKILTDDGEATIYLLDDKIAMQAEDTTIITKLLSGEYPDVDRVIPEKPEMVVSLHREELITLLRQVSLFAPEKSHSVRFTFGGGELNLMANTMDVGEARVKMPVNYQGEKIEIAFNPNYFLAFLQHSRQETVNMGVTDAFNPGILTDGDDQPAMNVDPSPIFVLMPMRLGEK